MKYKVEQMTDTRCFLYFEDKNEKGESLIIELTECKDLDYKNSLPKVWKRNGYIDRVLDTYWSISTYVRDTENNCCGKYNPQTKKGTSTIDFDWMLEATKENENKLIQEAYNRFMVATGKTATEIKIDKIHEFAKDHKVEVFKTMPDGWKSTGGYTAPSGSTWISNGEHFKSGKRKHALLIV